MAKKRRKRKPAGRFFDLPGLISDIKYYNEMADKEDPFRRPMIAMTVFFSVLFIAMAGYFTVYAMTHEQELMDNSYNNRQAIFSQRIKRGTIYASTGEKLAVSSILSDGSERRDYPYAEVFSHSVGFTGRGRAGIEASENYYLLRCDIPDMERVQYEVLGEKAPGDDVYTTLDTYLQEVAHRALGIYKGAIVAMDPKTGKILAMVSKPDYDPGQIKEIWEELLEDDESGRLVNRVTQGMYPAGSTFKIITALEYIRENPESYNNYHYSCSGSFTKGSDTIKCYHGSKHGSIDLDTSFAKSCNSSFANISMTFDKGKYGDTLDGLLFNSDLDLPFSYNKSSAVVDDTTSDSDVIQTAIGQGRVQVSPLHMAMVTSAIANDGTMMMPYMVDHITDADGAMVEQRNPKPYGQVMSLEESGALKGLMKKVVESGTGSKLKGLSYTAAGKTGSAEFDATSHESHAWFTGFAPVEDPQIVVTVIIEEGGTGGDYAVPTAKLVFDAFMNKRK